MYAITQQMAIGDIFDGLVPTTTPVTTNGVKVYPPDVTSNQGGLFEFTGSELRPITLIGIQVKLADQTSWAIVIVDPVIGDIPLASGTTETSYIRDDLDAITLLPGQKIKITSIGVTTAAMQATVMFAPAQLGEV